MGATLHRGARASHYCGLSCCGAQAPDAQAQYLWRTGLVALWHVGSSQTRTRTRVPCIGKQILNHCATREALPVCIFKTGNKCSKTGRERVVENNEGEHQAKSHIAKPRRTVWRCPGFRMRVCLWVWVELAHPSEGPGGLRHEPLQFQGQETDLCLFLLPDPTTGKHKLSHACHVFPTKISLNRTHHSKPGCGVSFDLQTSRL